MNKIKGVTFLVTSLCALGLWASAWNRGPGETIYNWEDDDNWTDGVPTGAPDFNGVNVAPGIHHIKINSDKTLSLLRNFKETNATEDNPIIYDIDLGGYTLKSSYANAIWNKTNGSVTDDLRPAKTTIVFRNGTLDWRNDGTNHSIELGQNSERLGGGFVISEGCTAESSALTYQTNPRVTVEKGGVLTVARFSQSVSCESTTAYGYFCVTGSNSRLVVNNNPAISGNHNRLYVLDGGVFEAWSLVVGNDKSARASLDTRCIIDGGTMNLTNYGFVLGSQVDDAFREGRLVIGADPRSYMKTKTSVAFVQGRGSVVEWNVPPDGWTDGDGAARAPICATTEFVLTDLTAGLTDYGNVRAEIRASKWMRRHPGETVTLMEVGANSAEALTTLAESASVTDFEEELYVGEPVFSVSLDGKRLQLTAPTAKPSPAVFTLVSTVGAIAEGGRNLVVIFADWGQWATSITQLRLFYGQKPDYSDATQVALPVTGLSGEVPLEKVFADVLPAHDPDKTYFCTVTAINDQGLSSSVEIIEDAGVAEWFRWTNAVSGDFYDLANWEVGETGSSGNGPWFAATHFPRGEDSIRLPDGYGAFTISATRDVEIGWIRNWTCDADMSHLHHCTFDMNGHALRLCGHNGNSVMDAFGYKMQAFDLSLPSACYTFKNAAIDNSYKWFTQGTHGNSTSSGIVLKDGSSTIYQCLGFNNGSVLRVESGSTLTMTNTAVQFSTSRARSTTGYGYVLVKDAGSSIKAATSGFTFGVSGCNMGLYVLEGGRMDADTLILGFGSAQYSGAPESVENNHDCFGLVSNATLTAATFRLGYNKEQVRAPKLTLAGTNTLVKVSGTFYNYRGTGAEFAFDLSADGFRDDAGNLPAPFVANALSSVSRGSFTDYGTTKLRINYKAAMDTLGGETVPLMTLATANAEGLQELADNAVYDRAVPTGCGVSVSADGKTLLMTVPKRAGLVLIVR